MVRVTVGARVTPTLPPKPKPNPKPKPKPNPNPSPSPNQGLFDKFPECGHDYRRADKGEFEVDDTGAVSMPLVGDIGASGLTLRSFEAAVRERLGQGYLKDPRVSVQMLNYRPFYIIGEVEKGGEYPFVSGMHMLNAVAVAGG